jgi:hypothetical protein
MPGPNFNLTAFCGALDCQLPRHLHLISDAHEWMVEIPTIPIYSLAKLQPRKRAKLDCASNIVL